MQLINNICIKELVPHLSFYSIDWSSICGVFRQKWICLQVALRPRMD